MLNLVVLLILSCLVTPAYGKGKPAYEIFDAGGDKASYRKLYKKAKKADIILFGELHNNPIAHWLRLELTKDLLNTNNLILGGEMFEADNQQALDKYLDGSINAIGLDSLARLWTNHKTDYTPIVKLAREYNIPIFATNIPRRFARMVYRQGDFGVLERLNDEEKAWIAPLPIRFDPELPQYKKILSMTGDHGTPELVRAQALKDATMAHFILLNYRPGHTFLHLNGSYHSDFYEGIVFYLRERNDTLRILTVSTVEQENVRRLEEGNRGRADFIICVDEDMTKTH
ncbi:MAG: ChaN family lipoprotein [Chlorobium phaeobacteroides]|uniref:Haem-binding uptake Tiki superfamily ChaN domain-containing protein n=1 Tax=Chlorobium phaeobacteroides (strain BS1) TaxID=331678 RepID=B3EJD7_CHLPB|nr:ChaN family lipoprotein [Chlorobium phaeobacteroides]